ncbi:hypothetical protein TPE_1377 [Treponema pedis str. T A4]|uniref:Uncharacterized protein n=1 Tax=Treponema pedis str. T A4 TaxID=1291379 RepID=S5ZMP9_9SPIR|nr:hypothetical protein TPE_1377 [Treponema pedis str. T A4]
MINGSARMAPCRLSTWVCLSANITYYLRFFAFVQKRLKKLFSETAMFRKKCF